RRLSITPSSGGEPVDDGDSGPGKGIEGGQGGAGSGKGDPALDEGGEVEAAGFDHSEERGKTGGGHAARAQNADLPGVDDIEKREWHGHMGADRHADLDMAAEFPQRTDR